MNPREAAKRLNIDWDTAAELEDADLSEDPEVPAAVVCFLCPSSDTLLLVQLIYFDNSLQILWICHFNAVRSVLEFC